ncbi:MAG TPA: diacylglycerol kinase family protein [Thermomicrobiales bacterium]|jgi:diacylglycerol kinase family enzyme
MTQAPDRSGRVIVVVNPATHKPADRIVAAVRGQAPPGVELDVLYTGRDEPVSALLAPRLRDAAAVIACGGDGTVAAVVTGLGQAAIPVGIIPAGSTNIVARENRIPLNPESAARLVFGEHRIARLDVGICNERRFLHMAGAGLDSRLFAATNPALKRRVGWPAYVPAALRSLRDQPVRFALSVDGAAIRLRSPLVLVANGAGIVRPSLPIFPDLHRDDGLLDVIAFTPTGPVQMGRTLVRFASRSLHRSPYVVHLRGRDIAMTSDPPIPYQLDGDVVGLTPATFGVLPGAVRLIVPPIAGRGRRRPLAG